MISGDLMARRGRQRILMLLEQPESPPQPSNPDNQCAVAAHWRDFATQHAGTLAGESRDLPNVSIFRGQFVTLYVVKTPDALELSDPGVGCEIFLLNASSSSTIPLVPVNLGMRAVRAFGPDGELLTDEVVTFPQTALPVPIGGFVRIA